MKFLIVLSMLLTISTSHSIILSESKFQEIGGNIHNIPESIKVDNEILREMSLHPEYLTVGSISSKKGRCTATLLGQDNNGFSYIFTAAHCMKYNKNKQQSDINATFTSWNKKTIAKGKGKIFVPKPLIRKPLSHKNDHIYYDMAILKLPTVDILLDQFGFPVPSPILNDNFLKKNAKVSFVGYGLWGVGNDISNDYKPAYGQQRRLYGENIVTHIISQHAFLIWLVNNNSNKWALPTTGDSGSAWWYKHKGLNVMVAITTKGKDNLALGSSLSKKIDWIKSVYSDVKLLSRTFLTIKKDNNAGEVGDYYQVKKQDGCYNYYELSKITNDSYRNLPDSHNDNSNWQFRGPFFEHNKQDLVMGDIFLYDNSESGELELFKLISPNINNITKTIPKDRSDNNSWIYMKKADIEYSQLINCSTYKDTVYKEPTLEETLAALSELQELFSNIVFLEQLANMYDNN
ncbi:MULTISPECIES: trypsin-like serine protease [unclassified Photobacterium]|uniref:trypsin-like serine protease n=1 Tax=unclassified Photobacterium TaxID=2628852 RepID=UPI000D1722AD|nr:MULTISPECIES: trypsin-like serine protease [unclassified Photobacterium]PSV33334.1 hypothetical protein C9J40_02415 [Photobacterium sp. GB-72]PSV40706.1 hypothetical protein C9J38_01325 [Photobacterium sp. GB-210]